MSDVTVPPLHSHWSVKRISPSLFALFIQPLAATIRQNSDIKNITTSALKHKIIFYAKDILLLLQNPVSQPLNPSLNPPATQTDANPPFYHSVQMTEKWQPKPLLSPHIKYLGITISLSISPCSI